MEVTEFIATYSDDVTFLEQAKRVLEVQNSEATWENQLRTASFFRIRAIVMIASIEHLP